MLRHYKILQNVLKAKEHGFRCFTERHLEEMWVSFYDLLRKSGTTTNLSYIFTQIQKHIPEIADCCIHVQLPGKGQHNTPAFPMTHIDHFEKCFTILSRHFPKGQTFREKPVTQYNIPLNGTTTAYTLPKPPPFPPRPKETVKGEYSTPKKEKTKAREASAHYDTSDQPRLSSFGWLRYTSGRLEPYKKEFRTALTIQFMFVKGETPSNIAAHFNKKNELHRGELWTATDIPVVIDSFGKALDEWEKQKLDASGRVVTAPEPEAAAPPTPDLESSAF